MPIRPPALDDRGFNDLVDELLARIPAHTPEWTNPALGDPGRTLVELFAWLTDTLLYRVNLIPERQRLAFLRLLGEEMQAAVPARGLVSVQFDDKTITGAQVVQPRATVKGPVNFETLSEMTVLPVTGEAYYKRPLTDEEQAAISDLLPGLVQVYGITGTPKPYATTPIFTASAPDPKGFDLVSSVDQSLWIALLATKDLVTDARAALDTQLLSVGFVPAIEVPTLDENIGPRGRIPHVWEITTGSADTSVPPLLTLDVVTDSTQGLRQQGVERLALPRKEFIGAPSNDVRQNLQAGVGSDNPPRLDDADKAARLIAWLRLRTTVSMQQMVASWVGVNAAEVEQRQTVTGRIAGQSDGTPNQEMQLPGQSVGAETLVLQVEESGRGFVTWTQVEDLVSSGRDAEVYTLDSEAGTVRFGDGLRGRIPEAQLRVRVASMRWSGGAAGNLPPGSLTELTGTDASGKAVVPKLKVLQTLGTNGGQDAETLAEAEQRIPALFRNRDRAVTEEDYKRLAPQAPGVSLGRVEVLTRFKPQQRQSDVPGVVSVMVIPNKALVGPPNPRADRPTLEAVHAYLSDRVPVATELYAIGCEYVPVSVSVAVSILDGFGQETVLAAVRDAVRLFLWPLAGGGTDGLGWRLGRSVRDREIDVIVARVPGIDTVNGVNLFVLSSSGTWQMKTPPSANAPVEVPLESWQLPELLHVVAVADTSAPNTIAAGVADGTRAGDGGVPVPVVPEVC